MISATRVYLPYDRPIRRLSEIRRVVNNEAVEEKRIDNLTRRFSYRGGGHLTRLDEIGYGELGERP